MKSNPSSNEEATEWLRHTFAGRFSPSGLAKEHSPDNGTPCELRTSLPVTSYRDAHFELVTTGDSCPLADGGVVTIVGAARFKSSAHAATAARLGIAVAVAHVYQLSGADVFAELEGSFSCCIIDIKQQRLLLGIDRMGQLSCYYHSKDGTVSFGTEATDTSLVAGEAPKLSKQGLYHYVYFHMVPAPLSVFEGLNKLPAAHYFQFEHLSGTLVNYWLPQFKESPANNSVDSLTAELRSALRKAVQISMTGQNRIGAFLSGGLDSSTVAGMMAELSEAQVEAFAIGFAAEGYDEMSFARITARHFGIKLNEYYVTPEDVVAALPAIAAAYDEPFGNSSALPAYFCARMAADLGIQTLLAGDGGDELFAGNERYAKQGIFEHYSLLPSPVRKGLLEPIIRALPDRIPLATKARSYIDQANIPLPDRLQSYNFLHRHAASDIFSDAFTDEINQYLPITHLRAIYERPVNATKLNRMLYLDWQITLADNDLRKVSQMCALAGVDVQFPMLEDALVLFSCRVPSALKLKGQDLRHFYKTALQGWLPDATIKKEKHGFGLPFGVWTRSHKPLRELAYDSLLRLKRRDIIRTAFIDQVISMHQDQHAAYYGELVWILTVLELWLDSKRFELT